MTGVWSWSRSIIWTDSAIVSLPDHHEVENKFLGLIATPFPSAVPEPEWKLRPESSIVCVTHLLHRHLSMAPRRIRGLRRQLPFPSMPTRPVTSLRNVLVVIQAHQIRSPIRRLRRSLRSPKRGLRGLRAHPVPLVPTHLITGRKRRKDQRSTRSPRGPGSHVTHQALPVHQVKVQLQLLTQMQAHPHGTGRQKRSISFFCSFVPKFLPQSFRFFYNKAWLACFMFLLYHLASILIPVAQLIFQQVAFLVSLHLKLFSAML